MYSFSLQHTIPRVTSVEEKDIGLLREKGYHTPATRKVQQLKNKKRIIKHTHDVFFFTLTHYTASHDRGRKRHQYVAGKGQPHTCKEKNTTLKTPTQNN